MPLQKCARCQKLFFKVDSPICDGCAPAEEDDYTRIREALSTHPELDAPGLAREAEVTVECVLRMLRDGRLESLDSLENVKCGRCGAPAISASKRLCDKCLADLDRACAEAVREMQQNLATGPTSNEVRKAVDAKRGVISAEEINQALRGKKPAATDAQRRMVIRDRLQGRDRKR